MTDEIQYAPGSAEAKAYEAGRAAARSARGLNGYESRAWRRGFAASGGGPDPAGDAPERDECEHDFADDWTCQSCDLTRDEVKLRQDVAEAYHDGWLARDAASNDDYLEGHRDGEGSDLEGDLADRVYRELHPGRLLDWDLDAARWREAIERALSRP